MALTRRNLLDPTQARNSLLALEAALADNFGSHKFVNMERYPMSPVSPDTSINHLPPERMTPEQRRLEIASILAKGLVRRRQLERAISQIPATERKVLLGFSGDQSVHTDLPNK